MDLLFIRHANNPAPSPAEIDPDLSQTGINQAHRLGERLQSEGIDCMYASTLRRAMRTAQIVGEHTGVPFESRDGLREISFGRLRHETWSKRSSPAERRALL
jgi:probable phosphoglycerate mutase